ncbi:putative transposase [Calderihabitans maritimus]|uniref:Putative transposase n=2 Tax=Calderihabitans maritimus TaxID=1246530 RepID=A0A1Z5HSD7_9FIRM|nr:putative transposase [Calderihabitans maritimus]
MMRARYRGLERVAIQVLMTSICLNAKKMAQRAKLEPEIAGKMI